LRGGPLLLALLKDQPVFELCEEQCEMLNWSSSTHCDVSRSSRACLQQAKTSLAPCDGESCAFAERSAELVQTKPVYLDCVCGRGCVTSLGSTACHFANAFAFTQYYSSLRFDTWTLTTQPSTRPVCSQTFTNKDCNPRSREPTLVHSVSRSRSLSLFSLSRALSMEQQVESEQQPDKAGCA
jgi:hypothetical protein